MRISRIFIGTTLESEQCVALDNRANQHVTRVLRLRSGASLLVFDDSGTEFEASIEDIKHDQTLIRVGKQTHTDVESPLHITLAQGISRGERMDYTLQKAVELGVRRIVPLWTEHTQVRLKDMRLEKRLAHWQGVVNHACQQCGRSQVPAVAAPINLDEWLSQSEDSSLRLLLDPVATTTMAELKIADAGVILLAGPEGGLSNKERQLARDQRFTGIRLGPRILRTETAALAAISGLQTLWGDFR